MVERVFISHTPNDEAAATSLAERLREDAVVVLDRTVFEEWTTSRPKGSSFNRLLNDELARCDAFVVFARTPLDRWQEQEVGAAIRRQWETEDLRIVPIVGFGEYLSGALARYQAVEMGDDPLGAWQQEVVQSLGVEREPEVETAPKEWSDAERATYRHRLKEISEIAKSDEASQQATEGRTWSPYK